MLDSWNATASKTKTVPELFPKHSPNGAPDRLLTAACVPGSISMKAGSVRGLSNTPRFHTKT